MDEVFGFGSVPKNADGHAPGQPGVAFKQNRKSFPVPDANLTEQGLVGSPC